MSRNRKQPKHFEDFVMQLESSEDETAVDNVTDEDYIDIGEEESDVDTTDSALIRADVLDPPLQPVQPRSIVEVQLATV